MDKEDRQLLERYENDFHQLASQADWTTEDLENMKNLQKLMYYIEVRCAMKEGGEYPGEEYMNEMDSGNRSFGGRSNNSYNNSYGGRYYDGNNSYNRSGYQGRSGMTSGRRSYGMPYMGNSYNSRRYYDSEKENAINDLRQMIQGEQDQDKISMLENIMHMIEK